jgi:hypothetical protein
MTTTRRLTSDERLADEVDTILIGCGLFEVGDSVSGGRNFYAPGVVKVVHGPTRLDIRILPGQGPGHFAKHAETIAYNLGMADVLVHPLEPYLIQLELVPKPAPHGQPGSK